MVAAAGNIDHDGSWSWSTRLAPRVPAPPTAPGARAGRRCTPRACFHAKTTEQYHLCLGAPGIPRGDDRRFALRVLDTILGGSTSSRLFQEVREKRGLAYSVYSYSSQYVDSGQVGLYVGTRPDNVGKAMDVIGDGAAPDRRGAGRRRRARAREGEREGPARRCRSSRR